MIGWAGRWVAGLTIATTRRGGHVTVDGATLASASWSCTVFLAFPCHQAATRRWMPPMMPDYRPPHSQVVHPCAFVTVRGIQSPPGNVVSGREIRPLHGGS